MKKRFLSILLTVAMALSLLAFPAAADTATSGTCGENLTWALKDGTLTISGTGDMPDWDAVVTVDWYSSREAITSVVIEEGATSIGTNAFSFCSGLTSVTIPDSVTSIGDGAFSDCSSLTSITIPDSVTIIEGGTFLRCSNLSSITIPDSVTSIGIFAFDWCTNLADVYYGGSEENWGKITIGVYNDCLTNATIHFNSAAPEPTITLFDDVQDSSSWYYAPVYWAVENHITSGTGDNKFSPSKECTRSQIVTFLWNAAGQPEPTTTSSKFTDVDSSAWYYKAVQWAVENNITAGTTETTFSPDMKCSRAQIVTFLWNYAEKASATQTVDFSDVSESAWYYSAVQWAVENKVTSGTGNNQFSPNTICTRAQAVTFLHNDLAK